VRCIRDAFAIHTPSMVIASDGRAASSMLKAASLVELDPEAIRPGSMASESRRDRAGVGSFYEYSERLRASRRKSPGDDLISKLIAPRKSIPTTPAYRRRVSSTSFSTSSSAAGHEAKPARHAIRLLLRTPRSSGRCCPAGPLAGRGCGRGGAEIRGPSRRSAARILIEEVTHRDGPSRRGRSCSCPRSAAIAT